MFNNINDLISFIQSLKRNEKKQSLNYMRDLCYFFGDPQKKVRYIHIGGTNGKGSTVSFLKNILMCAGYNVATFISPYVVCFNERISYNNNYISDEDLLKYGNLIIDSFPKLQKLNLRKPSFFEFVTLLAFLYFANLKDLDIAILEVGIGGTLDSTNVINPLISAVTNVTYDHKKILGNTLEEIWKNKLGIVKENTPFVTYKDDLHIDLIKETCKEKKAPLILINRNDISNININIKDTVFTYQKFSKIKLKLLGYHQIENAVLAFEIARNLLEFSISEHNIYQGLEKTFWPGRLEKISDKPLIFIDGAHNIDGIEKLIEFLKIVKDRFLRIVFAVSSDKDKEKMIKALEIIADELIFTSFTYTRTEKSLLLYNLSTHHNKKQMDDLDQIIEIAVHDEKTMTVFCGSLFFVSEIRKKFIERYND